MEKFFKELRKNPKPKIEKHIVDGRVFPYPKGELLKQLQELESMSDEDAYELISKELYSILQDIFNRSSKDYWFLLRSPKFLTILIQVVNTHNIDYDETVQCNSFIYKFLVALNGQDTYIRKLLFMLGEALNKKEVRRLIGCEIGEQLSIFLAVSLKSSFEPEICIKRFNFALCTGNPTFINPKKAIEIYEAVFDHVSNLIIYTIFDIDIKNSRDEEWVTEAIYSANRSLIYAVMVILESMVPIEITRVLISISEEFKWRSCKPGICMVDFHTLDKRVFNKTSIIIEQLEGDGYIFP